MDISLVENTQFSYRASNGNGCVSEASIVCTGPNVIFVIVPLEARRSVATHAILKKVPEDLPIRLSSFYVLSGILEDTSNMERHVPPEHLEEVTELVNFIKLHQLLKGG